MNISLLPILMFDEHYFQDECFMKTLNIISVNIDNVGAPGRQDPPVHWPRITWHTLMECLRTEWFLNSDSGMEKVPAQLSSWRESQYSCVGNM